MINILTLTMGMFIGIFVEVFLLKIFSFSLLVVIFLTLHKKISFNIYIPFLILSSIVLDTLLHMPLGIHLLLFGILITILEISWVFVPREGRFGYITIFFLIFSSYILLPAINLFVQERIFLDISLDSILNIFLKSIVSTTLCIFLDKGLLLVRDSSGASDLRLR